MFGSIYDKRETETICVRAGDYRDCTLRERLEYLEGRAKSRLEDTERLQREVSALREANKLLGQVEVAKAQAITNLDARLKKAEDTIEIFKRLLKFEEHQELRLFGAIYRPGSYSMNLGNHVRTTLKEEAVQKSFETTTKPAVDTTSPAKSKKAKKRGRR